MNENYESEITVTKEELDNRKELIETLNWFKSKMGQNFGELSSQNYYYYDLIIDYDKPENITINRYWYRSGRKAEATIDRIYNFNLNDICYISVEGIEGYYRYLNFKTYENQRLVELTELNFGKVVKKSKTIGLEIRQIDTAPSLERYRKAVNHLNLLKNPCDRILKEKF